MVLSIVLEWLNCEYLQQVLNTSTADDPALIPFATILPASHKDLRSAFVMGIIDSTFHLNNIYKYQLVIQEQLLEPFAKSNIAFILLNEEPNASPLNPKEPDSHIDEVIIKHDGKLVSSPISIYTITNVFNQIQLIAPFDRGGRAYNTYYIVDDGTCKVCVFNLYFETKGQATSTQEI
ncbi:MAG: hypothetical protein EZS28_047981, partial [Streblomastix strix]